MEHPEMKPDKAKRRLSRRTVALLCTLVALAIAVALWLLLPTLKTLFPSQYLPSLKAELPYQTLDTSSKEELDSITVHHADGESYTLEYREQQLYLCRDEQRLLVNEAYLDSLLSAATEITVEDTVTQDGTEVQEELADMGLQPPEIEVEVCYTTGRVVTLQLGAVVPDTTYHYYTWSGDKGVYMCSSGIYEAFEYSAQMLLPIEQPVLTRALVDRVSIRKAEDTLRMEFSNDGAGNYLGALQAPYPYPMATDSVESILSEVENFRLGTLIGPVAQENRADYGLDAPTITLDIHRKAGYYNEIDSEGVLQTLEAEETTVRFVIGAKDGDYFYFCEYAGQCYRVSNFLISAFLNANAAKMVTRAPANLGAAELSAITVQVSTGALDLRVTRTEHVLENNQLETDDNGETVYDVSVTANGEAITTDAFDAFVKRLQQMTVSGDAPTDATPTGTPRWTLTLTTTGGLTRTISAYPMDAFSDLLVVDGVARHSLYTEAIHIALGELYPEGE